MLYRLLTHSLRYHIFISSLSSHHKFSCCSSQVVFSRFIMGFVWHLYLASAVCGLLLDLSWYISDFYVAASLIIQFITTLRCCNISFHPLRSSLYIIYQASCKGIYLFLVMFSPSLTCPCFIASYGLGLPVTSFFFFFFNFSVTLS